MISLREYRRRKRVINRKIYKLFNYYGFNVYGFSHFPSYAKREIDELENEMLKLCKLRPKKEWLQLQILSAP